MCAGDDQHGQLGRGRVDALDSGGTEPVVGIDDAVSLCAAEHTSCAVRASGEVWCWGWNLSGQLGVPRTTEGEPLYQSATPLRAPDLGDSVACSIGREHVCALRREGSVRCWGSARSGQLGASIEAGISPRAAEPEGVDDVVQLASGTAHTCALTSRGEVWCWGTAGRLRAPNPVEMPGLADVLEIDAGGGATCARTQAGAVWCWGDGSHGQLGAGPSGARDEVPRIVSGVSGAVDLVVGPVSACALVANAAVLCWGERLHSAAVLESRTPVSIDALRGATELDDAARGLCAWVRGERRCAPPPRPPDEGGLL